MHDEDGGEVFLRHLLDPTDVGECCIGSASLSPQERKEALVKAAQIKARNADRKLFAAYLSRIRNGEIAPQTIIEETGRPYPTNGRTWYYQNEQEPMTDIGRVPGHEGMHVLRKQDGSLFFAGGYNLREEGETWDDFLADFERRE